MNSKEHKFVRFEDWHLERPLSSEKEASSDDGRNPRRAIPSVNECSFEEYSERTGERFYSLQWRTWSARFIQAAWRRHWKTRLEKSLPEEEDRLQDALTRDAGTLPSLLAAVYASKFAANALRGLRQKVKRDTRPSPTLLALLALLPQKPAEPDFTAEHH